MTTAAVTRTPTRDAVFAPVRGVISHREVIHLSGETKTGKTTWALATTPEPVFYLCFDPNGKGIAEKVVAQTHRDIRIAYFSLKEHGLQTRKGDVPEEYTEQWKRVKEAWDTAVEHGTGTLVVDTWTELYEECRLAEFGKVDQVRERYYGPINAKLKLMMRDLYGTNLNAILISKMRSVYVDDKRTDKREAAAWGDTDSEALSVLEFWRDDAALSAWKPDEGGHLDENENWVWPFHIYVTACRNNMTLFSRDLTTDLIGFKEWTQLVYRG